MKKILVALCILGIILSSYLTYVHYVPEELDTSFCNISGYLSCSTVNRSSFATFLGIPVALLGVIVFFGMLFLVADRIKHGHIALFLVSLASFLFMMYLTFTELFIINAICILCVAVAIIATFILVISFRIYKYEIIQFFKELRIE